MRASAGEPVSERYPGERLGLSLFLAELRPAVRRCCGESSMLSAAIRRALSDNDLARLRHARDLFNRLPRDTRQELSSSLVHPQRGPERQSRG